VSKRGLTTINSKEILSSSPNDLAKKSLASDFLNQFETINTSNSSSIKLSIPTELDVILKLSNSDFERFAKHFISLPDPTLILNQEMISLISTRCATYRLTKSGIDILRMLDIVYKAKNVENALKIKANLLKMGNRIMTKELGQCDLEFLAVLLSLYSKLGDKAVHMSDSELFNTSQEIVLSHLKKNPDQNIKEFSEILATYVQMKKGYGHFLLALEETVFKNLSQLRLSQITDLLRSYENRITLDYEYIANTILKPVMQAFADKFDSESVKDLSEAFTTYFKGLTNSYGLYYVKDLETKIRQVAENQFLLNDSNISNKIQLYVGLMTYAYQTNFLDEELALKFSKILSCYEYEITNAQFVQFGYILSRYTKPIDRFWRCYIKRVPGIEIEFKYDFGVLDTTLLALKHSNPLIQSVLYKSFSDDFRDQMQEKIRIKRVKHASLMKKPLEQKIAEEVLTELGVKFESEFFHIYCIDIAIPDKMIGLEFCGPNHYIWPFGKLNGRTLFKFFILRKLQWQIHAIKFKSTDDAQQRKSELKLELGSILGFPTKSV
jgi:hypothetical protein